MDEGLRARESCSDAKLKKNHARLLYVPARSWRVWHNGNEDSNLLTVDARLIKALSDVGDFSLSWFLGDRTQVKKEKEKFVVACLHPLENVQLGIFMS